MKIKYLSNIENHYPPGSCRKSPAERTQKQGARPPKSKTHYGPADAMQEIQ